MRIMVTGHNGYIGSVLAPFMAAAGHDVIGLDTYLFEDCPLGGGTARVEPQRCGGRGVGATDLTGLHAIIPLGAPAHDPLGNVKPQAPYRNNHISSARRAR